jgi:pimeloyl-ACP methyl ester carboxylesterase
VCESGGGGADGGALEAWAKEQPEISKFTRVVSYDRPGIAFPSPGPAPRDARQIARDLHLALQNAGIKPPYILVGHSLGGPYNRVFAGMYPDEVKGMVLVDPTQEEFIEWNLARHPNNPDRTDDEWKEIMATLSEAHESAVPKDIPVVLITGMGPRPFPEFMTEEEKKDYKEQRQKWLEFHDEWLGKLSNAQHIITEKSGHEVPFTEPELVVNAIRQVVDEARNHPVR